MSMQKRSMALLALVIVAGLRFVAAKENHFTFEHLTDQLHAALDGSSAFSLKAKVTATEHEEAVRSDVFADEGNRRQLRVRFDRVNRIARDEVHALTEKFQMGKTAERRSEEKLRLQLKTKAAELEKAQTEEAAEESHAIAAERNVVTQARFLGEAKANASSLAVASRAMVEVARKDRLGLLEQVSELDEDAQRFHKAEILSNEQVASVKKQAADERIAKEGEMKRLRAKQQRELSMLQSQVEAARADGASAFRGSEGLRRKVNALQQTLSRQRMELRAAETERDKVRAARDASNKAVAGLREKLSKVQESLAQQRQDTNGAQQRYEDAEHRAIANTKAIAALKEIQKSLEAQLADVNSTLSRQTASSQEQLHQTMLAAAARVHALEDGRENVDRELETQKEAVADANAKVQTLQNDLQRETDEAIDASRNATEARAELASLAESRQQASEKVLALAPKVTSLQAERDHIIADLQTRALEISKLQDQQEDSDKVAHDARKKLQALENEDQELKDKVANLVGESQRADDLAAQVVSMRKEADDSAKREADLKSEMNRLRDLKESYSQQSEFAQKESLGLRTRADDLDAKLKEAMKEIHHVTQQRDDSLEVAKDARTQEDEYFDENTRLQQQTETLTEKLGQAIEASNRSAESIQAFQSEVESAKAESRRQQSNAQAAWLANQKELIEVREELSNAQDEEDSLKVDIARTQGVLTVAQRQKLGLPVPKELAVAAKTAATARAGPTSNQTQIRSAAALQTSKLGLKVSATGRANATRGALTTQASRALRVTEAMVANGATDAIAPSAKIIVAPSDNASQAHRALPLKAPTVANSARSDDSLKAHGRLRAKATKAASWAADDIATSANFTGARSAHASLAHDDLRMKALTVANQATNAISETPNLTITRSVDASQAHVGMSAIALATMAPVPPTSIPGSPLFKLAEFFSGPTK